MPDLPFRSQCSCACHSFPHSASSVMHVAPCCQPNFTPSPLADPAAVERAHRCMAMASAFGPVLKTVCPEKSTFERAAIADSLASEVEKRASWYGEARLAARIAEVVKEDGGCWMPCSGCQESDEGYVSEKDYPYSSLFKCQPGGGCGECGGIGVVWWDGAYLSSFGDDISPASALASPIAAGGDHISDTPQMVAADAQGEDDGPVADAARRIASWSGDKVSVYQVAKRELLALAVQQPRAMPGREDIARVIDPDAWASKIGYCDCRHHTAQRERQERALAKADAIAALWSPKP